METVLIEVRDQKSMTLLRDLEALDIIKLLNQPSVAIVNELDQPSVALMNIPDQPSVAIANIPDQPPVAEKRKIAGRFAGKLSAATAEKLDQHIQQRRKEWNSI